MSLAWVKALMLMSNQDMLVKLVICKVGCIISLREAFKKKKTNVNLGLTPPTLFRKRL